MTHSQENLQMIQVQMYHLENLQRWHCNSEGEIIFLWVMGGKHLVPVVLEMMICIKDNFAAWANVAVKKELHTPASDLSCTHVECDIAGTGLVWHDEHQKGRKRATKPRRILYERGSNECCNVQSL